MNNPDLVRKIYAELCESVAEHVSSADLLRVASDIADAYRATKQPRDNGLTYFKGGIPFERWALDSAMADGGWRILRHELELAQIARGGQVDDAGEQNEIRNWLWENAA